METFFEKLHLKDMVELANKRSEDHGVFQSIQKIIPLEKEPKVGDLCPKCGQAELDYDGVLNLACDRCGFVLLGCFT